MKKYNYEHDVPFEAFITNLGKYNEGELVGKWIKFPATEEELKKTFREIGIGSEDEFGVPYEEWFITDYDVYVDHLYRALSEYESLDTLNELAEAIEDMDEAKFETFQAALEYEAPSHTGEVLGIIGKLGNYFHLPNVNSNSDLGWYLIHEVGETNIPDEYLKYIDYERYAEDRTNGLYTDHGYIE